MKREKSIDETTDLNDLFGEAADEHASSEGSVTDLEELGKKVQEMLALKRKVDQLEEQLDLTNKEYFNLNMRVIPEMMQALQLTSLTTTSGEKLSLEKFYQAKLVAGNEERTYEWLRERKEDAIIKAHVDMSFGRGEEEKKQLAEVVKALNDLRIQYNKKEGIHPQTLKSFVRQKIEGGEELPQDLFNVFVGNQIKVRK